jgi:hypothetical protein
MLAAKAKSISAALWAIITSLTGFDTGLPHWAATVPAILGAVSVYLVPNLHEPSTSPATLPVTIVRTLEHTGDIMEQPDPDPYASARMMGIGGIPPLPEKAPEDTPEVAALKAQIAKLTGGNETTVTAGPPAEADTPVQTATEASPETGAVSGSVAGRLREVVDEIAEIARIVEASGVEL